MIAISPGEAISYAILAFNLFGAGWHAILYLGGHPPHWPLGKKCPSLLDSWVTV